MTTLAQVVTAINGRLKTISGLNAYDRVPDSPEFPAVFVNPVPTIDYRDSLDDDTLQLFDIILVVSATLDEHQLKFLPYLERTGPASIFALFEANRGLGFTDVDAHIRTVRPLNQVEIAGYRGYGAAITLVVSIAGA